MQLPDKVQDLIQLYRSRLALLHPLARLQMQMKDSIPCSPVVNCPTLILPPHITLDIRDVSIPLYQDDRRQSRTIVLD